LLTANGRADTVGANDELIVGRRPVAEADRDEALALPQGCKADTKATSRTIRRLNESLLELVPTDADAAQAHAAPEPNQINLAEEVATLVEVLESPERRPGFLDIGPDIEAPQDLHGVRLEGNSGPERPPGCALLHKLRRKTAPAQGDGGR